MLRVEKFKRRHVSEIDEQDAEKWLAPHITEEHLWAMEAAVHSYTAFAEDKIVACAGLVELWPGRAGAWAILAKNQKPHFLAFHREVEKFLETAPYNRIEAQVDCGFKQGHRWMTLLGFECEAERARAFLPGGRDAALYARVKEAGCR